MLYVRTRTYERNGSDVLIAGHVVTYSYGVEIPASCTCGMFAIAALLSYSPPR